MKKKSWFMNWCTVLLIVLFITGCNQDELKSLENEVEEQEETIDSMDEEIEELEDKISNLQEMNNDLNTTYENLIIDYEALVAANVDNGDDLEEVHPIEQAFLEEMANWDGNTAEGVDISSRYASEWELEMNSYLDLIYEELDEDRREWLLSSQRKWEEFVIDNEELMWQANDQIHQGGTIMNIIGAYIYYERYKDRALFLKGIYDNLTYSY